MNQKDKNKLSETVNSLLPENKTIKVSILENKNQEIWSYGFENGFRCGVSNKSLDFAIIVELLEAALQQAKGELSLVG